jgi:hypothetical protein
MAPTSAHRTIALQSEAAASAHAASVNVSQALLKGRTKSTRVTHDDATNHPALRASTPISRAHARTDKSTTHDATHVVTLGAYVTTRALPSIPKSAHAA